MTKRFLIVAMSLFSIWGIVAQEGSPSPYSFFGIGDYKFQGTVENRSMGGLSVHSDSIHLNLQNPAAYGGLKLTTYTLAGSHRIVDLKSNAGEEQTTNSTLLEYLAVGFPAGKLGFGIGLIPYTSVGYKLEETEDNVLSTYSGKGGLNKVFLSAGYQINEHFKVGASAEYNFGKVQNKNLFFQDQIQFGTREINRSNLSGFSFDFGLQYQQLLSEKLQIKGSAGYRPPASISSENSRRLTTVILQTDGTERVSEQRIIDVPETDFQLPYQFSLGAGIGRPNKWFAGIEFKQKAANEFSNRSFNISNVEYETAPKISVGGFYVPNYNDITNYFNRIVYRTGFRYGKTGLNVNQQSIDEFGISFGVGLPVGRYSSNLNIGFEYGQRGTTAANLVEETFYNFFISLSLNDLWFQQSKYN